VVRVVGLVVFGLALAADMVMARPDALRVS
jgi:hypothetical protein